MLGACHPHIAKAPLLLQVLRVLPPFLTVAELSGASLSSLIDFDAHASINALLPLDVTIADFNLGDYGQPTITISGDELITRSTSGFCGTPTR